MLTEGKPIIYAHRGNWFPLEREQNSFAAIQTSIKLGIGIETDIRMDNEGLCLGHDAINESLRPGIDILITSNVPLALNIKQDGLAESISKNFSLKSRENSFVFDCSIPESIKYQNAGIPMALRLSEYEKEIPWKSEYIWLDSFHSDWWINDPTLYNVFEASRVVVVSPELHRREPRNAWEWLLENSRKIGFQFGICTDRPEEFKVLSND